jgi:1L-myo-inositol 1-phosphate cytidylyltransferase
VRTEGEAIVAIGKHLARLRLLRHRRLRDRPRLFAALNSLASPSLTEGMRVLAAPALR